MQPTVELGLDFLVLDDGFDDHVAAGQEADIHRAIEQGERRCEFRLRHPADINLALEGLGDRCDALLERLGSDIDQRGRDAAAQMGGGDPRSHDARADDAGPVDLGRLEARIGDAGILLQAILEEE